MYSCGKGTYGVLLKPATEFNTVDKVENVNTQAITDVSNANSFTLFVFNGRDLYASGNLNADQYEDKTGYSLLPIPLPREITHPNSNLELRVVCSDHSYALYYTASNTSIWKVFPFLEKQMFKKGDHGTTVEIICQN